LETSLAVTPACWQAEVRGCNLIGKKASCVHAAGFFWVRPTEVVGCGFDSRTKSAVTPACWQAEVRGCNLIGIQAIYVHVEGFFFCVKKKIQKYFKKYFNPLNQNNMKGKNGQPRPATFMQDMSYLGKQPPQAIDLEEAVLGALMLEKDALNDLLENKKKGGKQKKRLVPFVF
jgi:hypothetical protein